MPAFPENIKALRIREDRATLDLVHIPFASRENVKTIPDGYVLLKVRAVGLNPIDWKTGIHTGGYTGGILGCDAAGDVVAIGPGVTHVSVGHRAAGFTMGHGLEERPGAFAEYVPFSGSGTFKIPEDLSYTEAAALPIPLFTAFQTLYVRHKLPLPSSPSTINVPILIWGGSTAVGHYAIQLAALSGYKVIATAAPEVFEDIKALGATHVFDYKDPETPSKIRNLVPDLRIAIDTVGQAGTITKLVAESLSPTSSSNQIYSILPIRPSILETFPANTTAQYTIVYSLLGFHFTAGGNPIEVQLQETAASLNFIKEELPKLFGDGQKKIRLQKLRVMEGGLENIAEGLKIMKEGKYGREKLVYNIA
ncbi:chaperonin 10-like protein [Flagelloscypha sp. PMI_526]|nr:chaperonin 10-like protein [Flagelloscypha sp. PMI_526]